MTVSAMKLRNFVKASLAGACLLAVGTPLAAQDEEVVRGREPDMADLAATPVTDLNLMRDEIPEILLQAVLDPYEDTGLKKCDDIAEAIFDLDLVLGPDVDISDSDDGMSWRNAAQKVIGSFIPFRRVIREISGAAQHQREFETAILYGAVRRGYLKGIGQQKGCSYPARPAFERVQVTEEDLVEIETAPPEKEAEPELVTDADGVTFYSDPVVQGD